MYQLGDIYFTDLLNCHYTSVFIYVLCALTKTIDSLNYNIYLQSENTQMCQLIVGNSLLINTSFVSFQSGMSKQNFSY